MINSAQKLHKLSVIEISKCLIRCVKEWEIVVNNPKLFHGINHLADKNSVCTDFMKNYPLWRFNRPGIKTAKTDISELINPMLLAVLLCANEKTTLDVAEELSKTLGQSILKIDVKLFTDYFHHNEIITNTVKVNALDLMREEINIAARPDLMGSLSGFAHGAKYGIQAFKQIWYLRIDAMVLSEQMGWRVGRVIKSY